MLLTITYTRTNTQDLGYLLHKNSYRAQSFSLSFGNAYVFKRCGRRMCEVYSTEFFRQKIEKSENAYFSDREPIDGILIKTTEREEEERAKTRKNMGEKYFGKRERSKISRLRNFPIG